MGNRTIGGLLLGALRTETGEVENDSSLDAVMLNPVLTAVDIVVEYRELLLYREGDESEVMSGDGEYVQEADSTDGLLGGELVTLIVDRARGGTVIVKSLRPYIRDPKLEGGGGGAGERCW